EIETGSPPGLSIQITFMFSVATISVKIVTHHFVLFAVQDYISFRLLYYISPYSCLKKKYVSIKIRYCIDEPYSMKGMVDVGYINIKDNIGNVAATMFLTHFKLLNIYVSFTSHTDLCIKVIIFGSYLVASYWFSHIVVAYEII
ncbi:hypothetical protein ACJX0J_028253, partial [Zea mays]